MPTIVWLAISAFAQLVVILYPGVFVFWFVIHTRIEHWQKVGTTAYWVAVPVWVLTAGPLAWFRREIFSKTLPASLILQLAGVAALLLGVAIFRQARNRIPTRTMFGLPELQPYKHKQPLLNTGIYSKTRNPIYFAHWLVVFSAAALSGYVANWVFFALDCVLLPFMIHAEERELAGRYGEDFGGYMRRVPRFFPKLR